VLQNKYTEAAHSDEELPCNAALITVAKLIIIRKTSSGYVDPKRSQSC